MDVDVRIGLSKADIFEAREVLCIRVVVGLTNKESVEVVGHAIANGLVFYVADAAANDVRQSQEDVLVDEASLKTSKRSMDAIKKKNGKGIRGRRSGESK